MQNSLLFGATGHAGRAIARELLRRGHQVTAVVRDERKARLLLWGIEQLIVADVLNPATLHGICSGYEVVVSALGKSVSPNDWSRPSFEDIDYQGNINILAEARRSGVRQFVYLSAFGAEKLRRLTYFRVHDDFSNALKISGLNYAIIQPPAIMSSFRDLEKMARSGWLITFGSGDSRTNPIHEKDLAKVCADTIGMPNQVVAAGGKRVYTRREINEIIQRLTAPGRSVRSVPRWVLKSALPLWRILNRNMYDKLAFFAEVLEHDTLAPQVGLLSLEDYFTPDKQPEHQDNA
jgi:uncharacterized protein YbjT (DUF2867 family)